MSDIEFPFESERERQEFLISRYVDGGLSPEESAEAERLIAEDAELSALCASFRRVDSLVQAGSGDVPDVDWERFEMEAADRREQKAAPAAGRTWRFVMPVAAAAAVMFAALLWFQGTPRDGGILAQRHEATEQVEDFSDVVVVEVDQRYGAREPEGAVVERFQMTIRRAPEIESPEPSSMLIAYAGDAMNGRFVQELPLF